MTFIRYEIPGMLQYFCTFLFCGVFDLGATIHITVWDPLTQPIKNFLWEFPSCAVEANPTRNHEFAGSIPGLAQ